jgi:hypothetical protein
MDSKVIFRLQELIIKLEQAKKANDEGAQQKIYSEASNIAIDGVIPDVLDNDVFYTLMKSCKDGLIGADDLLVEAVERTIINGSEYIQFVGLALRLGATPNLYVTTTDDSNSMTVLHIAYYAWEYAPSNEEELSKYYENVVVNVELELDYITDRLSEIYAVLCVAGADFRLPVTNAAILLERKRNAADDKDSVVQTDAFKCSDGELESVSSLIDKHETDRSQKVLDTAEFYTYNRKKLDDYVFSDVHKYALEIINLLDIAEFVTRYEVEILDGENIYLEERVVPDLMTCIEQHSNKCVDVILNMRNPNLENQGIINYAEAKEAFMESVNFYNIPTAISLIRAGVVPSYNDLTRIILLSRDKKDEGFPASCAALNRILVETANRGISLDDVQLKEVGMISQSTFAAIKAIQDIPYWRRTCEVPGGFVRPDLKRLARELNIPADGDKASICTELHRLDQADAEDLTKTALNLQEKKLRDKSRSIGTVIAQQKGTAEIHKGPVCVNGSYLSKPEYEYADGDLVELIDGDDVYCFEAKDFPALLEPEEHGKTICNPHTGRPLNEAEIEEIRGKMRALERMGLPLESKGISHGIKQLKTIYTHDHVNEYVEAKVLEFFELAGEHGINVDFFRASPEEGGIPNESLEAIAQTYFNDSEIRFMIMNRTECMRDFCSMFMDEIDSIREMQPSIGESDEDLDVRKLELIDDLFLGLEPLLH